MISFGLLPAFPTWHRVRFSRRTADSRSGHVGIGRREGLPDFQWFSDGHSASVVVRAAER